VSCLYAICALHLMAPDYPMTLEHRGPQVFEQRQAGMPEVLLPLTGVPYPVARPAYQPQERRSVAKAPNAAPSKKRASEAAAAPVLAYAAPAKPKGLGSIFKSKPNAKLNLVKVDGNEVIDRFDPSLISILRDVQRKFGKPILIQSGYRSPAYNAALARRSKGVAKNSYHMTGRAADLRVQGVSTKVLYAYLKSHPKRGGIGCCMGGGYIHIDTGRKRQWTY
jgi:uncharacterized protein YcbK (DUF882 family)